MATYFKTDLGPTSSVDLGFEAVISNDSNIYFKITGAENYILQPSSKVRAMIVPSDSLVPTGTIGELLKHQNRQDNDSSGYFFFQGGENNTSQNDNLSFSNIKISNYDWENTKFDLHWMILRGSDEIYGNSLDGVYSFPHKVQSSEVSISGNLLTGGDVIQYRIFWDAINNEGSTDYGSAPTDGPYKFNVVHKYGLDRQGLVASVSGFSSPIYYASGIMNSGIVVNLPFYDERKEFQNVPAIYNFELNNVTAGTLKPGTSALVITMDHQKLLDSNNYFKDLDRYTFQYASKDKLKKITEIQIEPGVINRKRLGIGINDISIKDNTYVKQGIYVSKSYPLDFNIYTFSMKVDELIPTYPDLNSYDVVQYFVEFNSNQWERISPINRKDEFSGTNLVPKLFIFDKSPEDKIQDQVKYITYNSNVNLFRVKIVFDLSKLSESKFTPPEVRDYKCIIYDKDQFFNL
jgi:hypothetical protein